MLPPPIQSIQTLNYKIDKNPNRQPIHKKWQDNLADSMPSESNVQPTVVMPNAAHAIYHQQFNTNANDVNNKLSSHSPMYIKSIQSKKSWLQDLLQKEVAKPTIPSPVKVESITMLKLDDKNQFNKMTVETMTEIPAPFFVPTIQPPMSNDNKALSKELYRPMHPMNLIIQGHSRVKTYGQGTEERDPKIIEVKSVEVVSKDENGVQFDVKHLHTNNKTQNISLKTNAEPESKNSSVASLLSLLDLSFGDFLDNSSQVVQETKLNEIKVL